MNIILNFNKNSVYGMSRIKLFFSIFVYVTRHFLVQEQSFCKFRNDKCNNELFSSGNFL